MVISERERNACAYSQDQDLSLKGDDDHEGETSRDGQKGGRGEMGGE